VIKSAFDEALMFSDGNMPQFFIRSTDIIDNRCRIQGDDFRHLVTVRRVRCGDVIELRNEAGAHLAGTVMNIAESFIEVAVREVPTDARHRVDIDLYMSLLKGKNFDSVIEKAAEIGVSRIIPVVSERTIPHPSDADEKLRRWNRKALEAAKQCMRASVPEVERIHSFREAVDAARPEIRMIAHAGGGTHVRDVLKKSRSGRVSLMVGPEGGFDSKEIDLAKAGGWECVHIGFTQLRAATAAVVLCGIIIYELGGNDT
jgi:16S rRNA (uracil1498-N3)-methyltransferase